MNRRLLLTIFGCFALLPHSFAHAQEKTYLLRAKYTEGELRKYKVTLALNVTAQKKQRKSEAVGVFKIKMEGTFVEKTVTVKPDKSAVIVTQFRDCKVEAFGTTITESSLPEATFEVDSRGRTVHYKTDDDAWKLHSPMLIFLKMLQDRSQPMIDGFLFPEDPVKPGEKWRDKTSNSETGETVRTLCEAVKLETLNGVETLVVTAKQIKDDKIAMDTIKGKGKLTIDMLYNISLSDAQFVKTQAKFSGRFSFGPGFGDMDGSMSQSLLFLGRIGDDVAPNGTEPQPKPDKPAEPKGKERK